MRLHILKEGEERTISCLERANGRRPAEQFLTKPGIQKASARIWVTLELLAKRGSLKTPGRFKKLQGEELWELRDGPFRVFCFHHQKHIVLVCGVEKKATKHRRSDIQKANNMRDEFLQHETQHQGGRG